VTVGKQQLAQKTADEGRRPVLSTPGRFGQDLVCKLSGVLFPPAQARNFGQNRRVLQSEIWLACLQRQGATFGG
jgi:hypothetical protein